MTTNTRDVSLRWAEGRLQLMLPRAHPSEIEERAEALVTIAEHYFVPMEVLIEWIDRDAPGKAWSAFEWLGFCELYRAARQGQEENG